MANDICDGGEMYTNWQKLLYPLIAVLVLAVMLALYMGIAGMIAR